MEARIPARLSPAEGRRFAFPVGAALLVLALIGWWRGHAPVATALASIGVLLWLAGIAVPGKLGPVYGAWMRFALILSKVTTPVILAVMYFLVLTPIGLVVRATGRNALLRKEDEGSFWVSRPDGPARRSNLQRQF